MGQVIPFPIQEDIHWNGRSLTPEELDYVRELLLSVSRRIRIKRIRFNGVNVRGNDLKVIMDHLWKKRLILDEEKAWIYRKLDRET
ncbi:hypothetical protein [Ammoniphilus sp. YIM 78166]|uniref:hypothetical protein n=1 Tax=Ammoniphilus sp. YIM 78166 TaxID=1644106 RepID=UPI00106F552B|nr:hypothetical protein [Ammoniphilus sp. YIM 78166]